MPGLFAVLKNPSIFRQDYLILHPKGTRQNTKIPFMWGYVGVFSLEAPARAAKICPNNAQNRTVTPSDRYLRHQNRHFSGSVPELSSRQPQTDASIHESDAARHIGRASQKSYYLDTGPLRRRVHGPLWGAVCPSNPRRGWRRW
jgi:hypothetical protein